MGKSVTKVGWRSPGSMRRSNSACHTSTAVAAGGGGGERAGRRIGRHCHAERVADGLEEGQAPPRRSEGDGLALVDELEAAEEGLPEVDEHLLGELHEVVVVRVGLVELQHGEL